MIFPAFTFFPLPDHHHNRETDRGEEEEERGRAAGGGAKIGLGRWPRTASARRGRQTMPLVDLGGRARHKMGRGGGMIGRGHGTFSPACRTSRGTTTSRCAPSIPPFSPPSLTPFLPHSTACSLSCASILPSFPFPHLLFCQSHALTQTCCPSTHAANAEYLSARALCPHIFPGLPSLTLPTTSKIHRFQQTHA